MLHAPPPVLHAPHTYAACTSTCAACSSHLCCMHLTPVRHAPDTCVACTSHLCCMHLHLCCMHLQTPRTKRGNTPGSDTCGTRGSSDSSAGSGCTARPEPGSAATVRYLSRRRGHREPSGSYTPLYSRGAAPRRGSDGEAQRGHRLQTAPAGSQRDIQGRTAARTSPQQPASGTWQRYARHAADARSPSPPRRRHQASPPPLRRHSPPPPASRAVPTAPTPEFMRGWRIRRAAQRTPAGGGPGGDVSAFIADTLAELSRQSMSPPASRTASPDRPSSGGGLVRNTLATVLSDARHAPREWHPSNGGSPPGALPDIGVRYLHGNSWGHEPPGAPARSGTVHRHLDAYFATMRSEAAPEATAAALLPTSAPDNGSPIGSYSFGPTAYAQTVRPAVFRAPQQAHADEDVAARFQELQVSMGGVQSAIDNVLQELQGQTDALRAQT
eukprot:36071-Chlamydomonas_euryale.AAC.3